METVFDLDALRAHKRRALKQAQPGADFLMAHAAEELGDRLATVSRRFDRAATIFCNSPHAAQVLRESGKVEEVIRVEADEALLNGEPGIVALPETVPFEPASLDLAVSLLSLHEVNDLPGLLVQIRRALKPDGLFLACMAGAGTLSELRESLLAAESELGGVSPRVSPFVEVRDAGGLLQRAGFALPVSDADTLTVRYDSLLGLANDLRAMGASNALAERSRQPMSRALLYRAAQIYGERFADPDGRVRASFTLLWMSGWAPAASQPKPLKPGSATVSLAEALAKK
ncbi:class I SAM-dependent methyltransferase [Mesorhizobium sp. RP14(2022)]|uniref:Class I SAM-dependent methyltransferase n=1 Tax=Mesorhizobium liriopis TaxID=2953882 RepID=A0ABT1CA48_9HYPH|nr:class I SAM-dependent methyltransferase [Mesorhizobium liriopis]